MKYLSLCSGIEAATVAWHPLGWEPVAFSEIEPFPSSVLAHHYPNVPNLGDMTKYKEWPDYAISLLVGGTPCQSFSVAGLRKGLDDPRGNLMLTYIAIANRYRPQWLVWENVPGVLSSNGGRDFASLLRGLEECGYGVAYRVLDAQYVRTQRFPMAVPQRRRRVFVVGCLGSWQRAAAVLFERESLSGNSPPSRKTGERVAPSLAQSLKSSGGIGMSNQKLFSQGGGGLTWTPEISPTICMAHDQANAEIQTERSPALTCNHEAPVAVYNIFGGNKRKDRPEGGFYVEEADTSKCLDSATGLNPTCSQGGTMVIYEPIGFEANMSQQQPSTGNMFQTLTRRTHASVLCAGWLPGQGSKAGSIGYEEGIAPTPRRGCDSYGLHQGMQVRRLTPVECERLQGFPDGHTNIPWRGKPESPDGPRYKALGNSMAVNVMEWIGRRIQEVEKI